MIHEKSFLIKSPSPNRFGCVQVFPRSHLMIVMDCSCLIAPGHGPGIIQGPDIHSLVLSPTFLLSVVCLVLSLLYFIISLSLLIFSCVFPLGYFYLPWFTACPWSSPALFPWLFVFLVGGLSALPHNMLSPYMGMFSCTILHLAL